MSDEERRPKLHIEGDWTSEPRESASPEQKPGLHVDADWKAQAQAEKDRLVREEEEKSRSHPGGPGPADQPEASFQFLMSMLAQQAVMGLGALADRKTGGMVVDLEGARLAIDLLAMLEDKTRGNLSDEESKDLTQVMVELRARYVQIAQLVAQQAPPRPATGGGGPPPAGP